MLVETLIQNTAAMSQMKIHLKALNKGLECFRIFKRYFESLVHTMDNML